MTLHGSATVTSKMDPPFDTKLALRRAKEVYDRATDPHQRRLACAAQLRALLFAEPFERWGATEGLTAPLFGLLDALDSLDLGTIEPELQPRTVSHRPSSVPAIRGRAVAAATSIMLKRGGWSFAAADEWVSQRLNRLGYQKPSDRRKITPGTVRAWRKEVRKGGSGNALSVVTAEFLRIMGDVDPEKSEATAALWMKIFSRQVWFPKSSHL